MANRTRITTEHVDRDLLAMIEDLEAGRLEIPPHQRGYCWTPSQKEKFIQSILKGYPVPSILMSASRRGDPRPTLEDGQQRITTASKFRRDEFTCGGRLYSQMSEIERERFDKEKFIVITFYGATQDQRIEIFDWHQNGAPLTPGERYHAHYETPLIKYVKEMLMTPGTGLHDRAALVWGVRGDTPGEPSKDKRRKWLQSAVALVVGLAFGPAYMNKNYQMVVENGFMTSEYFDERIQAAVRRDLERILSIYEEVQRVHPVTGASWMNKHWDMGNFTGYLAYSLSALDRDEYNAEHAADAGVVKPYDEVAYSPDSLSSIPAHWDELQAEWIEFMVKIRRAVDENPRKKFATILGEAHHAGLSKARNWTLERWENGYNRIFKPEQGVGAAIENEEDSSGYDTDE